MVTLKLAEEVAGADGHESGEEEGHAEETTRPHREGSSGSGLSMRHECQDNYKRDR